MCNVSSIGMEFRSINRQKLLYCEFKVSMQDVFINESRSSIVDSLNEHLICSLFSTACTSTCYRFLDLSINRMMLSYSISYLLQLNHRSSCTPHRILGVTIYSLTTTRPCTQCLHFWPQGRPSYRSMPLMLPILSSASTLLPHPLANLGRSQSVSRSFHHLLQEALFA